MVVVVVFVCVSRTTSRVLYVVVVSESDMVRVESKGAESEVLDESNQRVKCDVRCVIIAVHCRHACASKMIDSGIKNRR